MLKLQSYLDSMESKVLSGHRDKVHSLGWNSDGRRLASGSLDHCVRIWSLDRKDSVSELKGHTGDVSQLAWDPNHPEKLCTASLDKTIKFWDARTPKIPVHSISTLGENINLRWSYDGKFVVVGNKDDVLIFFDQRGSSSKNPTIFKTLKMDIEVNEIGWDWSGEYFYMTTGKGAWILLIVGTVQIYTFPDLKMIYEVQAHTSNIYCIDFDPKGRYFALGGADALASVWDLENLSCFRTFGKLDWPVRTISLSYDGEMIASGSEENNIDISHVETGDSIKTIGCFATTNAVSWHPSKYILAFAGDEVDRYGRAEGNLRIKVFGSR